MINSTLWTEARLTQYCAAYNQRSIKKKRRANALRFKVFKINLRSFHGFKATCANVIVHGFALCVHIRNFLNVSLKRSSRPSLGMADVVSGHLTLTAYAAYSGHNILPPFACWNSFLLFLIKNRVKNNAAYSNDFNTITRLFKKIKQKRANQVNFFINIY